ncbi:methylmalonyl-CoA mutase family protein [Fluviicola sp.]|jgi:methylmalonyl-CoA mutase|uniref:methylmalonyl-CoA mutase family protein n=1 Tax=Fluviicola sp. TaxID=1917219 RepID=UPI00283A8A3E|nr:methylmalonyl-CoA mutase family protein [Fluviicola sp.]MDR0803337.1 methylmalonyl-CoA mutase family protein [Fluviicola sp.]
MTDLFSSFQTSSKEEWIAILKKELKGESIDTLNKFNRVEEITFPSYFHREDQQVRFSDPGQVPYTRGIEAENNGWTIATTFRIGNEKESNREILAALMSGTDHLILEATGSGEIDFETLLHKVELSFIHTTFHAKSVVQIRQFLAFAKDAPVLIDYPDNEALLQEGIPVKSGVKLFHINASSVQQAGGTTWQELAIALGEGHEFLVKQLDQGTDCDTAAANIHFTFGIGSKYFFELAKMRAFRSCWAQIVSAYGPKQSTSLAATITARTTFVNTSIKDPYTNLLRQTTEAMSAVLGGIQHLNIQPYDWYSQKPNTVFTRRMATNISLLLKEEAYLYIVIDPAGGSYALDSLTETIAERAWSSFQWIERNGGISNAEVRKALSLEISEKAAMRVHELKDKTEKRIGINIFPNPEKIDCEWTAVPSCWNGLDPLILEQTL